MSAVSTMTVSNTPITQTMELLTLNILASIFCTDTKDKRSTQIDWQKVHAIDFSLKLRNTFQSIK